MASKINRRISSDIKGLIYIEDDIIKIEVEDVSEPIIFNDFIASFIGKSDVKITITYGEEL
jgi:hypothetical protein